MKMRTFRVFFTAMLLTMVADLYASSATDFLRSTGKIYVVVAMLIIVFLGIVFFLFKMDKRLNIFEKKLKEDE